jgi:hypothetical protein
MTDETLVSSWTTSYQPHRCRKLSPVIDPRAATYPVSFVTRRGAASRAIGPRRFQRAHPRVGTKETGYPFRDLPVTGHGYFWAKSAQKRTPAVPKSHRGPEFWNYFLRGVKYRRWPCEPAQLLASNPEGCDRTGAICPATYDHEYRYHDGYVQIGGPVSPARQWRQQPY